MIVFLEFCFSNHNYRLPAIFFLVILLGGGAFFANRSLISQRRVAATHDNRGGYSDTRLLYWGPAITIWRENYWMGGGLNHFDFYSANIVPNRSRDGPCASITTI